MIVGVAHQLMVVGVLGAMGFFTRKLEVAIASFQFLARQFTGKRHGRPSSLRQQLEASLHIVS
ncbi:MAG: hypothetical protein EA394_00540 [Bacteroidia bacterium]|nr:MAG: hypothetical protein EA394_00540 [Bacteroidia bacterium]